MSKQLTVVVLEWVATAPSTAHEFEARDGDTIFRAFRHRTDYGWCWWEITRDGQPSRINSGAQTTLPRTFQEWR